MMHNTNPLKHEKLWFVTWREKQKPEGGISAHGSQQAALRRKASLMNYRGISASEITIYKGKKL